MKEASAKKRVRSPLPIIAALVCLFLGIVLVIYSVTGESMITYYYETDEDIRLVSVSPSGIDGVSCDTTVVIEWNHPVSAELIDAVTIRPSARGEWYVSGNFLMFTPQQLAAGEYYTVTIPKGTVLNDRGDTLQESIFFAFETEDADMRIPDTEAFDADGRFFRFSDNESVAIPVSLTGRDEIVDVTVYRADDTDAFIDTFADLNVYPSWAHLSIDRYHGNDKGFDKISETSLGVRDNNGETCVDLGSLPEGQYLVRLECGKDRRDVAVTVNSADAGVFVEDGALAFWSHKDGKPNDGAEIVFNGETYTLDENGFVSVPCKLTAFSAYRDPSSLAVIVNDADGSFVRFISSEELEQDCNGELILSRPHMVGGESLLISGSVFTESGLPVNGRAELRLVSSVETVWSETVPLENGCFSISREELYLTEGSYHVILCYDQKEIAAETLTVGTDDHELILFVEKSDDTVSPGDTVTYKAYVRDLKGKPVTDALVSLNGEAGVAVDKNGTAVFRKTYALTEGIPSVQKDTVFSVISDYGSAADVSASVSVVSGKSSYREGTAESTAAPGESLPLIRGEKVFEIAEEGKTSSLIMTYDNAAYDLSVPVSAVSLSVPDAVNAEAGETIAFSADLGGAGYRVATVSLSKGRLPDGLCGRTFTDESFAEHTFGALEENRVFFGGEEIAAAFSSENRNGDYYIRLAVKTALGDVFVRYIPVTADGVTVTCPENASIAAGHHILLPFGLSTDDSFDYTLTIGEDVYSGTTDESFSVSVKDLSTGQYHGKIQVFADGNVIASKEFDFEIYGRGPMFTEVAAGSNDNAISSYQVKKGTENAFISAYEIMSLPGDQILQRMGRTLFYDTFGAALGGDLSDRDHDLSSLQNADGSFGRYIGAPGDLLLSVFVAEREEFICDRASLCAYLKYRLTTADNPETAALACWGLSCFGIDCSDSMLMIYNGGGKTDRVMLYLAEGYEAAGNKVYAEKIYDQLSDELIESENMLHMPESEDQYNIANTAFMLDLSLKLDRPESDGLLAFLVDSDIQIQSGRYLLISGILGCVGKNDIAVIENGRVKEGFTVLSIVSADQSDSSVLSTSYSIDGEVVTEAKQGDIAEINVFWEAAPNSIYLVYVDESGDTSVIEKNGLRERKGYFEYVTNLGSANVSFKVGAYGDYVTPTVYIIDLTTGNIVGRSDESGLKVIR